MALQKARPGEIPPDAVRLTEREALEYQFNLLKNWKDQSDVYIFKYGVQGLGVASAVTGIYMNSYFRRKYKLGRYGSVATYLPTCILPTAISVMFHLQFVQPDIILFKGHCPVCIEIRAATAQVFSGGILPFLLGNLGCLGIAAKYYTYDLPHISEEPLKALKVVQKVTKPVLNILIAICIGHALLASTVTYLEGKAVYTVQKKLAEDQSLAH